MDGLIFTHIQFRNALRSLHHFPNAMRWAEISTAFSRIGMAQLYKYFPNLQTALKGQLISTQCKRSSTLGNNPIALKGQLDSTQCTALGLNPQTL